MNKEKEIVGMISIDLSTKKNHDCDEISNYSIPKEILLWTLLNDQFKIVRGIQANREKFDIYI